jgi:hypothetical protein
MNLDNVEVNDFEKFLEANPHLKEYKVVFPEPGVAVLSKEELDSIPKIDSLERVSDIEPKEEIPTAMGKPDVIFGPSSKIQVRKSSVHGYGVFAIEDIAEGEHIEECRLLRLGWRTKYTGDPVIKDYVWTNQSCKCKECAMHGPHQYLALGNGSIYNHADEHNTDVIMNYKNEVMYIKAKKFIPKDSEIFVNYGKNYWKVRQKKEVTNETKEEKISESGTKE